MENSVRQISLWGGSTHVLRWTWTLPTWSRDVVPVF